MSAQAGRAPRALRGFLKAACLSLPLLLGLLGGWSVAVAQTDQGSVRERELKDLRTRIEALTRDLLEKEASRREARDSLRESEQAISEANRRLRALETQSEQLRGELRSLAERDKHLAESLRGRQTALGIVLAAHYSGGAQEVLRVLLSGQEPLDAARRLRYLGYLSRESAKTIAALRANLAELGHVRQEREVRAARLREVAEAERADRGRIEVQRRERRALLGQLQGEIRRSRREIGALRADEARLARLVEELGKLLAARRTERPAQGSGASDGNGPAGRGLPFSRLRGRLKLPVGGQLAARFGAPEAAGGGKGVFIRADEGQAVRAVGDGQVVFADWMRGFGNLLILDHGESYLSVYANNESLLKRLGETVAAGETVATVGATGGSEKSGLYFELRHLGKAFDPMSWVR